MPAEIDKGFFVGLPKKALFGYPFWILVAALFMPLSTHPSAVGWLNELLLSQQPPSSWFQRSGTVAIALGVIIEALILNRFDLDIRGYPTMETERGFLSQAERKYLNWLQVFTLSLVIIGTIVSGYGDILHAAFFW